MTSSALLRLLLLSAIWGASFIFFRIIAPVLGPIWTAESRVLIAGLILLAVALLSRAKLEWRRYGAWIAGIGILNSGIPFALIAFAELKLTASMAAILNATSPLWAALIGALFFRETFSAWKGIGLALGIAGVAVLVGWSPLEPGLITLLSILAMLTATFCYGLSSNLTKRHLQGAPLMGTVTGSQLASSLALLPLIPFDLPRANPDEIVVLCLLALAIICTAVAYLLYYRLILELGATRALTVTFLAPIFGTLWGALFIGEPVTLTKVTACVIILCGAGFVTGTINPVEILAQHSSRDQR
jgi:drug/metabolite transporter (DMT)-like permease